MNLEPGRTVRFSLVFVTKFSLAQLKPSALAEQRQLYTAHVLKPIRRTQSRDHAAHAVRAPVNYANFNVNGLANMQQVLVQQENALVNVLQLRMQLQAARFAHVVPALLVSCYFP